MCVYVCVCVCVWGGGEVNMRDVPSKQRISRRANTHLVGDEGAVFLGDDGADEGVYLAQGGGLVCLEVSRRRG